MEEIVEQLSLWGDIYPFYHIDKKLRVIEMFGGVGSQIAACNVLFKGDKNKFEQYKLVEWCYQSYCAYNSIHIKDFKDYSKGKTKEEIIKRINGTSTDCETPLSIDQLNKKSMEWLKSAYNNCEATHNLINIMNVHGKDLEINDTNKYDYLLFYSFPCQDISMAGKMQGVKEGTRSGLLLEVERILDELKDMSDKEGVNHLPSIMILENVEALCNRIHIKALQKWVEKLGELGFTSYCDILNGVDYGIPQTRKRTFLVSIKGQFAYDFPRKIKPKYKLKNFLENDGVIVNEGESLFSDSELSLITPEGDLRRYIGSEIVDKFNEGQIATTTFPNGYGHGPRTHNDCITLNTVDRPIVKQNLRIRKLTELECWKLMGFTKSNFAAMEKNHFSQSELYRMAGDSIIVCCIIALLSPLIYDRQAHVKIINEYVEKIIKGE